MAGVDDLFFRDVRIPTRTSPDTVREMVGKVLSWRDVDVFINPWGNPVRVLKPNGEPLLIYLPRAIPEDIANQSYPILHSIRIPSHNRGEAAAAPSIRIGNTSYSRKVRSAVLGSLEGKEGSGVKRNPSCRLTQWTGEHVEQFRKLFPLLRHIAALFSDVVPDRFQAQRTEARRTKPEWVIEGTPFTTITVNNTYATGVHTDKGDLDKGFSCLAVLRRGEYIGGHLCMPGFGFGVDLQDRDLVLMDAHEWHGNIAIEKLSDDAERISLVAYMRTELVKCGTAAQELERARRRDLLPAART